MSSFGSRLKHAFEEYGRLCVGIDPHPGMLPEWGLPDDASGLREFGSRVVEASVGRVGVVKPQVAFFEAYGVAGMRALAETIAEAKQAGLLVIADAKRGDIGSTMAAYAEAWLNPEGDFGADALTVSPFLGFGSLDPAVEAAHRYDAGLFVLALTSNPEGQEVQLARTEHGTIAAGIASRAAALNGEAELGSIGLVVGATTAYLAQANGIDLTQGRPPLLAPGYGAQGATAQAMREGFGDAWDQVLVNSSRDILRRGPEILALAEAVDEARADVA
ncbi:orotidine-5'-phosphate decarboxylase [Nesterenkonia flava]|uniref:Orotidine 5'-phosphate decarboxylase n=1 Tax=Nesterenkonia flava TaxID=469799 RepID=A0ABU1FPQ9_9MICC|nr:orotidine-5'-phosphate decarboxylase [Nesterenkonia flava]MDR5710624.1 orotidine-5'-phosphate decarboxylase [Nesterenkonia flava]